MSEVPECYRRGAGGDHTENIRVKSCQGVRAGHVDIRGKVLQAEETEVLMALKQEVGWRLWGAAGGESLWGGRSPRACQPL